MYHARTGQIDVIAEVDLYLHVTDNSDREIGLVTPLVKNDINDIMILYLVQQIMCLYLISDNK